MTDPVPDSLPRPGRPGVIPLTLMLALLAGPLAPTAPAGAAEARAAEVQEQLPNRPLTLEDAIRLAEARSEQIAVARAGVNRAAGEETRARADLFPQLSASVSYDRTLASEFSGIFDQGDGPPACDPFTLRPTAPLGDRVGEIERAIDCGAIGGSLFGGDALDLPFGRENIYRLNLSFSQTLYSGGRVGAQRALAGVGRQLADVSLTSARAQIALDVTEAYYDAALSGQLLAIAESGLRQASATLSQVELARQAGRLPEFELLRARVARDNQRPIVLRARAQRTLAYLRLQQLLHVPDGAAVQVAANLEDPVLPPPAPFGDLLARADAARGAGGRERVAIRQAAAGVDAREAAVRIARSQRLPSVSANSSYGRVGYSSFPGLSDFRTNWTVGVAAQVPILTGGRIRGDEMVARADLAEARAQLDLARNLAQLDTRAAFEELDAARATWEASAGTVEQAAQAYQIAELRYREGISTQLELSDSRFLLEQAQANRAQAARDLQVARARVALLPDLPFSAGGPALSAGATGAFNQGTAQASTGGGIQQTRGSTAQGGSAQTQTVPGGIR